MSVQRLLVDWKALKQMGWPYSRAHTWRLMAPGWEQDRKTERGLETYWVENRDPFPACIKLGNGGRVVWRYEDILAYLKRHGLAPQNAGAPQ